MLVVTAKNWKPCECQEGTGHAADEYAAVKKELMCMCEYDRDRWSHAKSKLQGNVPARTVSSLKGGGTSGMYTSMQIIYSKLSALATSGVGFDGEWVLCVFFFI